MKLGTLVTPFLFTPFISWSLPTRFLFTPFISWSLPTAPNYPLYKQHSFPNPEVHLNIALAIEVMRYRTTFPVILPYDFCHFEWQNMAVLHRSANYQGSIAARKAALAKAN